MQPIISHNAAQCTIKSAPMPAVQHLVVCVSSSPSTAASSDYRSETIAHPTSERVCSLVGRPVALASVLRFASTTTSTLAQWQPSPLRRRLQWDGVPRMVTPARREDEGCSGPSSSSQEQGTASEDGEAMQAPSKSTASDLGGDVERRTAEWVVDWTLAIDELWAKRRRGEG